MHIRFVLVLLLAFCNLAQAQTVTIFRSGLPTSPTYSSIQSAVAAALDADSLVLSADTFRESNILVDRSLSITGTQSSGVFSLIDGGVGNDSTLLLFNNPDIFSGVKFLNLRDVHFTNGKANNGFDSGGGALFAGLGTRLTLDGYCKLFQNTAPDSSLGFAGSRNGGAIFAMGDVFLKGHTQIENNTAVNGGAVYALQALEIGDSVLIQDNQATLLGGGIFAKSYTQLTDDAILRNNRANQGAAVYAQGNQFYIRNQVQVTQNKAISLGGALSLQDVYFEMMDSVIISHNEVDSSKAAAIYSVGFNEFYLKGGQIVHNKILKPDTSAQGFALFNDSALGGSSLITLSNLRIFNPQPGLTHRNEVHNIQVASAFLSDSCWWGKSDTSGLIFNLPSATVAFRSWVICDWRINNALPIDTQKTFPVSAQFSLHSGASLPSQFFWMLQGVFASDSGSFSPTVASMSMTNDITSIFSVPYLSKAVQLSAVIDEDSFSAQPYVIGLSQKNILANKGFSIFPNPASQSFNILCPTGSVKRLQCVITDMFGMLVLTQFFDGQHTASIIPVTVNLESGHYLLQLIADGRLLGTEKLVIQGP